MAAAMKQVRRSRRGFAAALSVVAMAVTGCAARVAPHVARHETPLSASAFSPIEVIGELKDFGEAMGGHPTENFLSYSPRLVADERCYFTGKLQLPEFYSRLHVVRENEQRCTSRADTVDVFFYPVQAVASGDETITVSLTEAPVERMLVVVPHEDFHNQAETRKAPTEVAESAATLVGFLTARAFAKERFGEDSMPFRMLAHDVGLFLRKSLIVNAYYERVSELYRSFRDGALTQQQALARKAELFAELQQSCSAIAPEPVSFNKCPAAMNNAGLAFDQTYTRHYPLMHELYTALGEDAPALVAALKRLLPRWPSSVTRLSDLMNAEP
jgi:hypothetical protein